MDYYDDEQRTVSLTIAYVQGYPTELSVVRTTKRFY